LLDRRRGRTQPQAGVEGSGRAGAGTVSIGYFDLNVRHFREKLSEEHQIGLCWVKQVLQDAGLG